MESYTLPKFNLFKKRNDVASHGGNKKIKSNMCDFQRTVPSTPFCDISNDTKEDNDHTLVRLLVIGAGERNTTYCQYSKDFPYRLKIVCIAEQRESERLTFQTKYNIEERYCFSDWKDALQLEKFADAVLIDNTDYPCMFSFIDFINLGYHVLCEKSVLSTEQRNEELVEACKKNNVVLCIADVLRYSNTYRTVKKLIFDDVIGDVLGIQQIETVGWWHFTHLSSQTYCSKGKKNLKTLMDKTFYDLDLIKYLLGDMRCKKLQSFGSLTNFSASKKLSDICESCMDRKAEKLKNPLAVNNYFEPIKRFFSRVRSVFKEKDIRRKFGSIHDDNFFCDYQTINMEFDNGKYVTFTMSAFTKDGCSRKTDIFGTTGQIECNNTDIKHYDYTTGKSSIITGYVPSELTLLTKPGYSDYYLMKDFLRVVAKSDDSSGIKYTHDTLSGNLLVIAAERSRKMRGAMLDVDI